MLILFLLSVIAISLSGVMMPGPVLAITIKRSYKSRAAGPLVAVGHGIIEIPLIISIYFGLSSFFKLAPVQTFIGVVGGGMLIYMGINTIKTGDNTYEKKNSSHNSVISGIVTSAANPYFFLWWATIGAALIIKSTVFGVVGFILFIITHWLCDLGWYSIVSIGIHKTGSFGNRRLNKIILHICSLLLLGFGLWFIISVIIK
ncbi:MAG: LysE family transporter [Candidatus Aerophobetes bacterium]|nr:LysE family transporter [Candidatus Aerophobetes bacterium]